jgi:peptide/nickel transport system substrate-binding protein
MIRGRGVDDDPPTGLLMRTSILTVSALALLAACGGDHGGGANGTRPTGGTLVFAAPGDPTDVFPAFVTDQVGNFVVDLVFDHLADISNDLKTIGDKTFSPRLAKSWTWAPDSLSIMFSLDPHARWHDGKPVTAADVRYSLKTMIDPRTASPTAALLENVDSVSIKDSLTAVVWFKKHTPEQFYDVAYQLYIVPEHVYGRIPLDSLRVSPAAHAPIGSGQFRFVQWQPDVRMEFVADTANYHGRPKLDRVIVTPIVDPATRKTQVLTAQADYVMNFPSDQTSLLDSSKVARGLVVPSLQYMFMGMNLYSPKASTQPHPIFGDIRVRRAISMSLDRVAMLHSAWGDHGLLAHGPFPMALSASDSTLLLPRYDTTAAAALLDSAGWRRGKDGMRSKGGTPMRFALMTPAPSGTRRAYAVFIQGALHREGVTVDIDPVDPKVFTARVQTGGKVGDFDAILMGFSTDPSPSGMRQNWGSVGIGPQGQNVFHYSNAKVDALIDSLSGSFDGARAKQYAARAFQQIIDDAPAVWLYDLSEVDAVSRRIEVGPTRADGWWRTLAEWSIPPAKRIDRDRIPLNAPSTAAPH